MTTATKPKRKVGRPAKTKEEFENPRTENGKYLEVKYNPERDLFHIVFTTGGQLPSMLKGHFTRKEYADQKIWEYLYSRS